MNGQPNANFVLTISKLLFPIATQDAVNNLAAALPKENMHAGGEQKLLSSGMHNMNVSYGAKHIIGLVRVL